MLRVIGNVLHYCYALRNRKERQPMVTEHSRAEQVILTWLQQEYYSEEYKTLTAESARELLRSSALYPLNPVVDENGVMI